MITTFPSLNIDIENYSAIKQHLLGFGYDRLKQTGETGARKQTNNKWFETQDSISYWEDFYRQKIVYPDIMRMPRQEKFLSEYPYFYLDDKNFYTEATNFIMTGNNIDLIYLFLVSDIGFFVFSKFYTGPQFDATGFRYKKAYLDEMFIPIPNDKHKHNLREMIKCIKRNEDVSDAINRIWCEIIKLTDEEIWFIKQYKKSLLI